MTQFIAGLDYDRMNGWLAKGSPAFKKVMTDHLVDAYKLIGYLSKWGKPVLTIAGGHMESVGASLLAASPISRVMYNANCTINEATQYGLVPLGGATFWLSRLPRELGTFIALTGQTLTAQDMVVAGFADRLVNDDIKLAEVLESFSKAAQNYQIPNIETLNIGINFNKNKAEYQIIAERKRRKSKYLNELYGIQGDYGWLVRPNAWSRLERRAEDLFYGNIDAAQKADIDFYDRTMRITNKLAESMQKTDELVSGAFSEESTWNEHMGAINRCFYPDSIEEIKELLKKENTDFSRECLKVMNQSSPISLALTLRLLREARSKDYSEAMAAELGVAVNRVCDSEFPLAVKNRMPPGNNQSNDFWKYKGNISEAQIDEYFHLPGWVSERTIGLLENSFYPTRAFYKMFPDAFRHWLHGDIPISPSQRIHSRESLIAYIQEIGLDVRDSSISADSMRKDLMRQYKQARVGSEWYNRFAEIASNEELQKLYFGSRGNLINKFCENDETYYAEMNKRIEKIFSKFYEAKMDMVKDASNNAHKIQKHRFFLRLKKFLLENRVLISGDRQAAIVSNKINAIRNPHKLLPQDSDGNYRPHGSRSMRYSFLYYVAETLKKETQLYPKLMQYFNYPEEPKEFVRWLLDLEALEKLRKRIKEDKGFVDKMKNFYNMPHKISNKWYEDFIEEAVRMNNYIANPNDTWAYDAYLRIRKKAEDLQNNLQEVLLKELDDLIKFGQNQKMEIERKRQNVKESIKQYSKNLKPEEYKPLNIPKTPSEFAESYLRSKNNKLPFYNIKSANSYIKQMSNVTQWLLSNVIEIQMQKRRNLNGNMPLDFNLEDEFDKLMLSEIAGKGMVGPMENEVMTMLGFFMGPIISNQLDLLYELNEKLSKISKENTNIIDLLRKTAENLQNSLKAKEWDIDKPEEHILSRSRRKLFENEKPENLPDFEEIMNKLGKNGKKLTSSELETIKNLYNSLNDYMIYLTGSMLYLQRMFYIEPELFEEIVDSVGMTLIDKLSEENLQNALSGFRSVWNHYFSIYELPNHKADTLKIASKVNEIREKLKRNPNLPYQKFFSAAIDFPEIVNIDFLNSNLEKITLKDCIFLISN